MARRWSDWVKENGGSTSEGASTNTYNRGTRSFDDWQSDNQNAGARYDALIQQQYEQRQAERQDKYNRARQQDVMHRFNEERSSLVGDLVKWSRNVGAADYRSASDLSKQADMFQEVFTKNRDAYDARTLNEIGKILQNGRAVLQQKDPSIGMNGAERVNYIDQLRLQQSRANDRQWNGTMADAWTAGDNPNDVKADAEGKIDALRRQNQELKRQNKLREFETAMQNPDYAEKSQYQTTANGKQRTYGAFGATSESGFNDLAYDLVNKNPEAIKARQNMNPTASDVESRMGADAEELQRMTDDEVQLFNYYYAQDPNKAREYLTTLRPTLMARQSQYEQEEWQQRTKDDFVGSSILSVPARYIGGLDALVGMAADKVSGRELDTNAGYLGNLKISNAIRQTGGEMTGEWLANALGDAAAAQYDSPELKQKVVDRFGGSVKKFGNTTYGAVMSAVDQLWNLGMSGGAQNAALVLMASSAMPDTIVSAKEQGLSDKEAISLGVIAGVAEYFTEKVSLEALLDMDSIAKNGFLKYVAKAGLAEGSEEVASDFINFMAQEAIAGENSDFKRTVKEYQRQGMSHEEAVKAAWADQVDQSIQSFLGGAIAGGGMAVGMGGTYSLNEMRKENAGKEIKQNLPDYSPLQDMDNKNLVDYVSNVQQTQQMDQISESVLRQAAEQMTNEETVAPAVVDAIMENDNTLGMLEQATGTDYIATEEEMLSALQKYAGVQAEPQQIQPEQIQPEQTQAVESSPKPQNVPTGVSEALLDRNKTEEQSDRDFNFVNEYAERYAQSGLANIGNEIITQYNDNYNVTEYNKAVSEIVEAGLTGQSFPSTTLPVETASKIYDVAANERSRINGRSETVRLQGNSGRALSESAGRQSEGVGSSTTETYSGRRTTEQTKVVRGNTFQLSAEQVTAKSLGIPNGTDATSVQIVSGGLTPEMTKLQNTVRKRGNTQIHWFVGDNLSINGQTDSRGLVYTDSKGTTHIFARADHPVYTADQIALHELYHDGIAREAARTGEKRKVVSNRRFRQMAKNFRGDFVEKFMLPQYVKIYEGTGLTLNEVREELLCDMAAGMNEFAKVEGLMDIPALRIGIQSVMDVRMREFENELNAEETGETANETRGSPQVFESREVKGNVIDLTNDNELSKIVGDSRGNARYRAIQTYVLDMLAGQPLTLSDGTEAIVNKRDAQHLAHKALDKKTAEIGELKKLAEQAEYCAYEDNVKHDKFDYFKYYEAYVKYENDTFPVYLNIGRGKFDNLWHLYDITHNLRSTANRINDLGRARSLRPENGTSLDNNTVPQTGENDNTKFSREITVDSTGRKLSPGQQEFYKNVSEYLLDENGALKRYYHGTARMDRVGTIFDPNRATSGPMAFFTDNREIAEGYSTGKNDTSLAYEDANNYHNQFVVDIDGEEVRLEDYWNYLSPAEKEQYRKRAGQITYDDDYEFTVDENETRGNGGYASDPVLVRQARGNAFRMLVDAWLDSGDLFGEEERFLDVLNLLGVEGVRYKDPDARVEGVYEVYLNVTNPFSTDDVDDYFAADVEDWLDASILEDYQRESWSADGWDKNDVDPYEWLERLQRDIENNTTHAWTSIPDIITDFLKSQGYDGIVDQGGKNGGFGHQVVIPFSSEQVKNIDNLNPTENPDIRYSKDLDSTGKQLSKGQAEYFRDSKARDDDGRLLQLYHGTTQAGFTVFNPGLIWLTTSRRDADSYGGNDIESKIFDADEDRSYETKLSTIADLVSHPRDYKMSDIRMAMNAYDENNPYYDMVAEGYTKADMIESLKELISDDSEIGEIEFKTESKRGKATTLQDGRRTYSLYANVENPMVVDMGGLAMEQGGYKHVEWFMDSEHDGLIIKNTAVGRYHDLQTLVLVRNSEQVKLTTNTNPSHNPDIRYSRETSPAFYSQLERMVKAYKGDKIGASSLIPYLKGKGIKDEEIKWTGIQTFLEGKKSVSKADVLEYIRDNELQIEDTTLAGSGSNVELYNVLRNYGFDIRDYTFEMDNSLNIERLTDDLNMSVEEGEMSEQDSYDIIELANRAANDETYWDEYKLEGGENYREILYKMPGSDYSNTAMKMHWSSKNTGVVAHARVQDFGDILFVEEIQSDWHNAGKKGGYKSDVLKSIKDVELRLEKGDGYVIYKLYVNGKYAETGANVATVEDKGEEAVKKELLDYYISALSQNKAPDAPFKNNYTDFVLKDLLRKAAEEGYKFLAWTTAQMQADRWSDEFMEGYRIEYDQEIPKFLKKYGKQWGAQLTEVPLEEAGESAPAIQITDAMRESVLTDGQPMFSRDVEFTGELPEDLKKMADAYDSLKKDYKQLQTENRKNKGRAEYFKGETKLNVYSDNPQVSNKAAEKIAKGYVKTYNLEMDKEGQAELTRKIRKYAEDYLTGKKDFDQLADEVLPLANEIVRNAKEIYESPEKEMIDHIWNTKIKISDTVRTDIPGYAAWKRGYAGKMKISTMDGMPIEDFYRELQDAYGSTLFPDDIMNPTDQLMRIAEITDTLGGDTVYNFTDIYDMAEATQSVAFEIMQDVMGMDLHKTFADREKEKRENLKSKMKEEKAEALAKAREDYDERAAKLKKEMQQTAQERIKAVREHREKKLKELKEHYKEVAKRKRLRKEESDVKSKLLSVMRRLDKASKTADKVTKELIQYYIGDYDLVAKSITGKKIDELIELEDYIKEMMEADPDFQPSERALKSIERLHKKRISDIETIEQAYDLTVALLNLEHEMKSYNKLIDSIYNEDIIKIGSEIYDDIMDTKGIGNTKTRFGNWFQQSYDSAIARPVLRPETEVLRLVGFNRNSPLYQLMFGAENSLASGQRDMVRYQWEANRIYFDKFLNDREFANSIMGKNAKEYKITGRKGNGQHVQLSVTPDLLMALYMHLQNKQNFRHFGEWIDEEGKTQHGDGITIPNFKLYKAGKLEEAYRIAARDGNKLIIKKSELNAAMKQLTKKEMAFVNAAQRYYSEMSQPEVNRVSERLLGYGLAQVENYFRINTDADYRGANMDAIKRDGTIEGMGNWKERVPDARNAILLISLTEQLKRDLDAHSKYVGLAIPVRNFNKAIGVNRTNVDEFGKWMGSEGSVQSAIKGKWGKGAADYLEKLLSDIQNPKSNSEAWNKILGKLRSAYAGSVLALNAGVAIKQAASYPTAAAEIGWKPLIKAFGDSSVKKANRLDMNLVNKYSPLMYLRTQGMGYQELADLKNLSKGWLNRALNSKALNWIQDMDVATVKKLWKAAEYYVRDNFKDLEVGSDAYYKKVGEIHSNIIEKTQPNYTTLQRGEILRSDSDLVRMMLGMFKTQPFQNFSILFEATGDLRAKSIAYKANPTAENKAELRAAGKKFARAVSSQLVASLIFALMQGLWDWTRGKDDKYKDEEGNLTLGSAMKQVATNMAANGFGMIPLGNVLYEVIDRIFDKKSSAYGLDASMATGIVNDLQNATFDLIENMRTVDLDNKNTTEQHIRNYIGMIATAAQAAGYPADNFLKDAQTIAYNMFRSLGATGAMNKYEAEYYAKRIFAPVKSGNKKDYMDLLYRAYDSGDKEAFNNLYKLYINDEGFETDKHTSRENVNSNLAKHIKEIQTEKDRVNVGLTTTDINRYNDALKANDANKDGQYNKDEVYKTLMEIDLTMKQKEELWAEQGYKQDKKPQSLAQYQTQLAKKKK